MSCTGLASLRVDLSRALWLSSPLLSSAAIPARSPPPARTLARTYIDRTSYPPVPGTTCSAAALRVCPSRCTSPAYEPEGPRQARSDATLSKVCA
ncbi:hypothetical protein B0H14DRAFT_2998581, partial [Mycena olivaceomarginata]